MNADQLEKKLKSIEKVMMQRLNALAVKKNIPLEELGRVMSTDEFAGLYEGLGLESAIASYTANYNTIFAERIKGFSVVNSVAVDMEMIKELQFKRMITKVSANLDQFQATVTEQLLSGIPRKDFLAQLKLIREGNPSDLMRPITDAQLNTAIHTAQSNFGRITTAKVFEDKPEQKFEYVGGTIPTSSDACRSVMNNQSPEGYTRAEIEAGIDLGGGEVNWFGRVPNYNCIHSWLPID